MLKCLFLFIISFSIINIFALELTNENISKYDLKVYQEYLINDGNKLYFRNPTLTEPIMNFFPTQIDFLKGAFSYEALPYWGLIISSTGFLYYYDQNLLDWAQRVGRDLGLGNNDHTKDMITYKGIGFRGPTDTASWMYFIGDGWTDAFIMGSFLTYGLVSKDKRAIQTGSQLITGLLSSGFWVQILKRSFGRESPYVRSEDRGAWRPFPSPKKFNGHTSKYDAMPSGHMTTATMVLTVIAQNYPEYSYFILPIGTTLMTILGYQMMNNGVHWISDYPLAIGMGYLLGKVIHNNNTLLLKKGTNLAPDKTVTLEPMIISKNTLGVGLKFSY